MSDSPGFRRLKAHPDYANMVKRTLEEQRIALEEVSKPSLVLKNRSPKQDHDYPAPKKRIGRPLSRRQLNYRDE